MKILKIWTTFQTELKYHDHYLADEMKKEGIETVFLSSDKINKEYLPFLKNKSIKAGKDNYNGSKIIRLKSFQFMGKPFIFEVRKMYKEIKNGNYDIIHIFGISNPISILCLILVKLSAKNIPIFFNDHSNPDLKNQSLIGKIYYKFNIYMFNLFRKNISKVFTPNIASYKLVKNRYNLNYDKISVIPLGYDSEIFYYSDKKNAEKSLVLGFAGKLLANKRIELLIDVLSEINDPDIVCEVIGLYDEPDDYQNSLIRYAKEKNVVMSFKPLIKDPMKLAQYYNYIDVAIFPGSISITTLEATGCGTPIILYESIEGLEDRVQNGRGILFKEKIELVDAIKSFKNKKNNNLIDNKMIEKNSIIFSWNEISKKYLDFYNKVI